MLDLRSAVVGAPLHLSLRSRRAMQAQAVDPAAGELYVTQEAGTTSPTDTIVTRLTPTGARRSEMRCIGAGHGSGIAVLRIAGRVWIVLNWAGRLVRVPYTAGDTLRTAAVPAFPERADGHCFAHVNHADGTVCIRTKRNGDQWFRLYPLDGIDTGLQIGQTIGPLSSGTADLPYQGCVVDGDTLYLPQGYGGRDQERRVDVWSFNRNRLLYSFDPRVGPATWVKQEPESGLVLGGVLHLGFTWTDNDDGKAHVLIPFTEEPPTMHPAVAEAFYPEMERLEGNLRHLYLDTLGLPTTGVGQLLGGRDGLSAFGLALPWRRANGEYATEAQVAGEFARLKALGIEQQGGRAYEQHATLWLDAAVVMWLFARTTKTMESTVAGYFPSWNTMHADAQLAVMSMAWNMGPHFPPGWPTLTSALRRQDYVTASDNCEINARPGDRNRRNRTLFLQAARAKQFGGPPERLYGPEVTLDASVVASADPGRVNAHAWWVQAMLRILGHYTAGLDGLYGPMSKAAFAAWAKSRGVANRVDQATLGVLSHDTLRVTVVA